MLETSIPLSGIQAAALRLGASASNIAIMAVIGSLPARGYTSAAPQAFEVLLNKHTSDAAAGGESATQVNAPPSFVPAYKPQAPYASTQGLGAPPNVNVLNGLLNIATATASFAANAKVAEAVSRTAKEVAGLGSEKRSR
jgi:flagellar basal-body rod protein FlgC